MKKLMLSFVVICFGVFLMASSALALSSGILEGGFVRFQFQNWDVGTLHETNLTGADGDTDTVALIAVTNINPLAGGPNLWANTGADALNGILYGVDDNNVVVSGGGSSVSIDSIGGFIKLYAGSYNLNPILNPAPVMPMTGLNAPADVWGATTGGPLFLELKFVPGVIDGDFTTTFHVDQDNLTAPISGSSSGFMIAVAGSAVGDGVDQVKYGTKFYFIDHFDTNSLTPAEREAGWLVGSGGNAYGVPEPASLLLLGLGLLGIGLARRYRREK